MDKKKIGFLINNMSNGGGTERVTSIIANELNDMEYEIFIFSCKKCDDSKFNLNNNINIISLLGDKNSNVVIRKVSTLMNLNKYVKKYNIDILIAVDTNLILYTLPIKLMNNIRIISWEHFNFYSKRGYFSNIARLISAKYSDALIVLGERDKENYLNNIKKIKKIEYIYNPIALDLNNKSSLKENIVLAVGRLENQKGFDMLIESWKYVESENNNWTLRIVGSGSQETILRDKIEKEKIKNIEIIPFQYNIEEYYINSSIFVLSSRYEGFGLVLLEAQAKGLPIVSFDCKEGPSEIIDNNVNGYLVEPNNTKMLADKVLRLINNEQIRVEFSEKSQKDLDRFNIDLIIKKWMKLIENL